MRVFINYIKSLSDNNLEFYGAIFSLLISTIAAILSYNWRDIKIIFYLACSMFFISGSILVYVSHFRQVKPFMFSMFLSIIATLFTGIILVVYLKFLKNDTGFTIPIAFISQLIIANLIKHILKLN